MSITNTLGKAWVEVTTPKTRSRWNETHAHHLIPKKKQQRRHDWGWLSRDLLPRHPLEWISCMIEPSFVQFSKQFARSEKGALSKASWSVLDDYFLFQNNYYKGKMGYIAVKKKIWLSPNSSTWIPNQSCEDPTKCEPDTGPVGKMLLHSVKIELK